MSITIESDSPLSDYNSECESVLSLNDVERNSKRPESITYDGKLVVGNFVLKCGQKFFVEVVNVLEGPGTNKFRRFCGLCSATRLTSRDLKKHFRDHQRPVHCCVETCNEKFAELKYALRHVVTWHKEVTLVDYEGNEQKVDCMECGKSFTRQDNLLKHKNKGACARSMVKESGVRPRRRPLPALNPMQLTTQQQPGPSQFERPRTPPRIPESVVEPELIAAQLTNGKQVLLPRPEPPRQNREPPGNALELRAAAIQAQGVMNAAVHASTLHERRVYAPMAQVQLNNSQPSINPNGLRIGVPLQVRQDVSSPESSRPPTRQLSVSSIASSKRSYEEQAVAQENNKRRSDEARLRELRLRYGPSGFTSSVLHIPDGKEVLVSATSLGSNDSFFESSVEVHTLRFAVKRNTTVKLNIFFDVDPS